MEDNTPTSKVFLNWLELFSKCLTKHGRNKRWDQLFHLSELSLWHSVPVEDDPGRLVAGRLVELDQELSHHRGQVLDDLLSGPLDPYCSTVPAGMGVHAAHNLHSYNISQRGQQLQCLGTICLMYALTSYKHSNNTETLSCTNCHITNGHEHQNGCSKSNIISGRSRAFLLSIRVV